MADTLPDGFGIAFRRRAVAAPACGLDLENLPGAKRDDPFSARRAQKAIHFLDVHD